MSVIVVCPACSVFGSVALKSESIETGYPLASAKASKGYEDVEFFKDAISEGSHPGVHPVVRSVPVELP